MSWKLKIIFDNGTEEIVDEDFETEADAECEYQEWLDSWGAGRETLQLAGEEYCDYDIEDCEIWEE